MASKYLRERECARAHVPHEGSDVRPMLTITVVGIVRTAKYSSLKEESPGTAYVPFAQGRWKRHDGELREIRSANARIALIPLVKSAAAQISPAIPLDFTGRCANRSSSSLSRPRVLATLSGFFGALALLLATIGVPTAPCRTMSPGGAMRSGSGSRLARSDAACSRW